MSLDILGFVPMYVCYITPMLVSGRSKLHTYAISCRRRHHHVAPLPSSHSHAPCSSLSSLLFLSGDGDGDGGVGAEVS